MEQMVLALFDDHDQAARAVDALSQEGLGADVVSVLMHEGRFHHEDLDSAGTEVRRRAVEGAAIGGAAGAVLGGLVLGPFGLLGLGPLATALFAGGGGGFYGALAGALTGRDEDKPKVEKLAKAVEEGKVLVTVDTTTLPAAEIVERILEQHGGRRVQLA